MTVDIVQPYLFRRFPGGRKNVFAFMQSPFHMLPAPFFRSGGRQAFTWVVRDRLILNTLFRLQRQE
jgi:hypothetical protein